MAPVPMGAPDKRERLLAAAKTVFAEKGFAGAAIADIAMRAEIGKGTVYEYYKSKEDLFFAVFEWFMRRGAAAAKVDISVLGLSAGERLAALSESVIGQWAQVQDEFTLVMEFWAASSSQNRDRFRLAFRKAYENYRAIVTALLREGMARGEFRPELVPESVAAAVVGAWDALFLQAWFDESFDPHEIARDFIDALIGGLRKKSS